LAEPDGDELVSLLRRLALRPDEARQKGEVARRRVLERLTWQHGARLIQERLRALAAQPVRRLVGAPRSQMVRSAPAHQRQGVTLCMIVKNEEHNLGACLASVAGLFAEIIIVDTGS